MSERRDLTDEELARLAVQAPEGDLRPFEQLIEELSALSPDKRFVLACDDVDKLARLPAHDLSALSLPFVDSGLALGSPALSETIFSAATSLSPSLSLIRRTPCVFLPIERYGVDVDQRALDRRARRISDDTGEDPLPRSQTDVTEVAYDRTVREGYVHRRLVTEREPGCIVFLAPHDA